MSPVAVPLAKAYRLINHGPTVLVTSAHQGRSNVMAAAWNMALDFEPAKVCVVIDKTTFTRQLIEASGAFALNVPRTEQVELTRAVGTSSGRDADKFAAGTIPTFAASLIEAPLVADCLAWLECRVIPEEGIQARYDLFIGAVVAAWADPAAFSDGHWHFPEGTGRSIHHIAGGAFFETGRPL